MVSPPSKLKMFTSVSLKLTKIKIKLIYATTSSWEKKQNGGWKLRDTDWFYFSFYNRSCFFLWTELIRVQFYFIFIFLFDPSWSESIRVDPTRTGGPSWSGPTFVPACKKASKIDKTISQNNLFVEGCPSLCLQSVKIHETSANHGKKMNIRNFQVAHNFINPTF